jgi:AcrR family transcriptional regulator
MANNPGLGPPNGGALGPRRRLPIEQRRAQVLDAALTIINDHGHRALSVEAVARQARVSKTVVYSAYGGLEPLLHALLDREEAAALASLAHAAPANDYLDDPATALSEWLRALLGAVSDNPVRWRLMLLPADGTPPVVRERVQRGREIALAQARRLAAALLANDPDIDLDLAARAILAIGEEHARLLLNHPDQYQPDRLVEFTATLAAKLQTPVAAAATRIAVT